MLTSECECDNISELLLRQQVEQVVRKQKRAMIRDDIRRQKKERARQAQIAKRMEEGNDNW